MNAFCYLCQKNGQYGTNLLFLAGLKSQHSKKACNEIINEMLIDFLPQRKIQDELNCSICTICFNLIEDYDFHCISSETRKKQLRQMLVRTEVLRIARNKNITIKKTMHMKIQPNGIEISSNEETGKLSVPNDSLKLIMIPSVKSSSIVIPPKNSSPIVIPPVKSSTQPQPTPIAQPPPKPIDNVQLQSIAANSTNSQVNNKIQVKRSKKWPPRTWNPKRFKTEVACEICDRKFLTRTKFESHQKWHLMHPGFRCFICYFSLSDKDSLLSHEKLHDDQSNNECVICGKAQKSIELLRRHAEIHGEKSWLCDLCGMGFTTENALKGHRKIHTKEWKGECDTCGHICYSRSNLIAHMKNHLDVRRYTCAYCGFAFKRPDTLKTHEKRHRENTKTLKCSMCTSTFEHKFFLKQHMKNKHQIENLSGNSIHTGSK